MASDLPPDLVAAIQSGRLADAERAAHAVLAREPGHAAALNALGVVHIAAGSPRTARRPLSCAAVVAPHVALPAQNLALTFLAEGDADRARTWSARAVGLDPGMADAHATLASAERARSDLAHAWAALRRGLALAPSVPDFLTNAGNLHLDRDAFDEACVFFHRALSVAPQTGNARFQLACVALGQGRLEAGWSDYEARFLSPSAVKRRPFPHPWWRGQPLGDARLLVWAEQGLAEEIAFSSLLPAVLARTPRVTLECDPRLVPIFLRSLPGLDVRPRLTPPHPDLLAQNFHQVALGSLPRLFPSDLESVRGGPALFHPEPGRVATARDWLARLGPGPKVGIAWRSIRRDAAARRVHTAIEDWRPILATPGVVFVNLQYDDCAAEIAAAERETGARIHRMPGLDLFSDLEGTLALSSALDLAITTITTAHAFPAAAGIETWLLRPMSDYFALGHDHYPWYPRTRCFVRPAGQDWRGPLAAVAEALRRRHPDR